MRLIFDQARISRSTTRAEWREIDRWRRVTQKRLGVKMEKQRVTLAEFHENLALYGSATVYYRRIADGIIADLVNPAVIIYPPFGDSRHAAPCLKKRGER